MAVALHLELQRLKSLLNSRGVMEAGIRGAVRIQSCGAVGCGAGEECGVQHLAIRLNGKARHQAGGVGVERRIDRSSCCKSDEVGAHHGARGEERCLSRGQNGAIGQPDQSGHHRFAERAGGCDRRREGRVQRAIGVQPGQTRAGDSTDRGEGATDEDLAVGENDCRVGEAVQGLGLEGGVPSRGKRRPSRDGGCQERRREGHREAEPREAGGKGEESHPVIDEPSLWGLDVHTKAQWVRMRVSTYVVSDLPAPER